MGLSVDKVFRFVQFVSNKEHRGWVSPEQFNLASEVAQLSLYSEKEAMFMQTKKLGADMRPFKKKAVATPSGGSFAFPSSFRHLIRCYNSTTFVPLKEVEQSELPDVMDSSIVEPSADYPIIVDRDDQLYVYPTTYVSEVTIEYLAKPSTPNWDYTTTNNRPVYASATSDDFDFDEVLFLEIASRILEHIGLNLSSTELSQYQKLHQQKEAN